MNPEPVLGNYYDDLCLLCAAVSPVIQLNINLGSKKLANGLCMSMQMHKKKKNHLYLFFFMKSGNNLTVYLQNEYQCLEAGSSS